MESFICELNFKVCIFYSLVSLVFILEKFINMYKEVYKRMFILIMFIRFKIIKNVIFKRRVV